MFLIGCDPELFVKDSKGQLLSAHGMIPGSKKEPHRVDKGAVQVDGMALEFNIDPVDTEAAFIANVSYVMAQMKKMIPHEFFISSVAHFGEKMLSEQPPEAVELGCDPDYNGWTAFQNPIPDVKLPFRTASGHVHLGWRDKVEEGMEMEALFQAADMAVQLDFVLGLPSLLIDSDPTRRQLYGKAGAFRPKPYGMEYRVLSNFWLSDPSLMGWVYRTTSKAADQFLNKKVDYRTTFGDIQDVINNSDVESAKTIIRRIGAEIPNVR